MSGGAKPRSSSDLAAVEALLGYRFKNRALLQQALVHRSHGGEGTSYERLEFLGDRVLGVIVAEQLYARFPSEAEGPLARRFVALVRAETLARVAADLKLGENLVLSRGEEDAGGRQNPALLSDACEAVIGAVFLDGGFEAARTLVAGRWEPLMEESVAPPQDARTALQEWAQRRGRPLPTYETLEASGPGHNLVFTVQVSVEGLPPATATGASKRAAAKAAAETLLRTLT